MGRTLLDKVWDSHRVRDLPDGRTQLFVGLHLIHEVTSPQAFGMLRDLGLPVRSPERTFATIDHIIQTAKASISMFGSSSRPTAVPPHAAGTPAAPTISTTGQLMPSRRRGISAAKDEAPTTRREVGMASAGVIPTP